MNYNHPDLIKDWKQTCERTDGCTSYLFKWFSKFLLWVFRAIRNYGCDCCRQHDFFFEHGPKYGITFEEANKDLRDCIIASNVIRPAKTKVGKWFSWLLSGTGRWSKKRIANLMYAFVSGPIGKRVWNNYRRADV